MDITVNQHVSTVLVTSCMLQNSWMATVHLIMDNALQWKNLYSSGLHNWSRTEYPIACVGARGGGEGVTESGQEALRAIGIKPGMA